MNALSNQWRVSSIKKTITIKKVMKLASILALNVTIGMTGASASEQSPLTFIDTLTAEEAAAYTGFQKNADIIRLHHLKYWVDVLDIYHSKMGKYPFQGETNSRVLTFVATPRQQKYTYEMRGITHRSMTDFVAELEKGIGHSIDEYYDPQYAPDAKPNYYIYVIDPDNRYYFAIHTHQNYPFSRHVRPYYNKVEVSNIYSKDVPYILTPDMLFDSDEYKKASHQPIVALEFFKEREALTLQVTKQ